jgi:hypothetical protein
MTARFPVSVSSCFFINAGSRYFHFRRKTIPRQGDYGGETRKNRLFFRQMMLMASQQAFLLPITPGCHSGERLNPVISSGYWMSPCGGITESCVFLLFAIPSVLMDSQKGNRMAKQKSPYTRHRAFPGAQSYM